MCSIYLLILAMAMHQCILFQKGLNLLSGKVSFTFSLQPIVLQEKQPLLE